MTEGPTTCKTCGAIIGDDALHRAWHNKGLASEVRQAEEDRQARR